MGKKNKPTLLLAINNSDDRLLIEKNLPAHLPVEVCQDELKNLQFDLCILDKQSFNANKKELEQLKQEAAPVFLPILLLSKSKSQARSDAAIIEFIDDVVYTPVSQKVLQSRIELLLRQRDYSVQLEEQSRQLAEEKERYRLITEHATDMVVINDPDGIFTYVSPSCHKMTGFRPEELLGQSIYDFIHPDDLPSVGDARKIFMGDTSSSHKVSFRFKTKQDKYKWVESNVRSIRDESSGEIIEIQGALRDISHRKAYEQKLEEEKAFIDSAVESLPGIFFLLDQNMSFVRWNDNFKNTLGYTDDEISMMKSTDFFEPEHHPTIYSKIQEVLQQGVADLEIPVAKKDGELVSHYLLARTIYRNGATFIIGTGIDISERVAAENKLKESERRWEKLVEKNPSMVQLTTRDDRIEYANPACLEFYGVDDVRELVGKSYSDFITFESKHLLRQQMVKVLKGLTVVPQTYQVKCRNGREGVILLQAARVKHNNDQVLLTVAKDITQRYKYEHKLMQSLEEKKTLLQEIHHRVKNNLAVVSGMLQLQSYKTDDEQLKKLLTASEKRIKTMALIHEKLYQSDSLSKINFGSYAEKLIDYIQQVVSDEKKVNLELAYDLFELNINQAVPSALILNELIANSYAHAFVNSDCGTIDVVLHENDDQIFIQVKDDGQGLPPDFDVRRQQSMGYTIIETLIKQLDATLDIQNEQGVAISFTFSRKQEIKGSASSLV